MPIRNPFRRAAGGLDAAEYSGPDASGREDKNGSIDGAKPIHVEEPREYKLSGTKCWEVVVCRATAWRIGESFAEF